MQRHFYPSFIFAQFSYGQCLFKLLLLNHSCIEWIENGLKSFTWSKHVFIAKICVKLHVSNHKILIDYHCKENNICMSFWQLCLHLYRRLLAPTPGTTSWKVPRGTLELLWYPVQWAVHHYQHADQKICWLSIQEVQSFKTSKKYAKNFEM